MLTAITGGIGAGKSVVSTMLTIMGYEVYDCDSNARILMDKDFTIHKSLCEAIHPDAVVNHVVDRRLIASIVFNDSDKLKALNEIVHHKVIDDLTSWCYERSDSHVFVETAILKESGIDRLVDDIWLVEADIETRINRVVKRNGLTRAEVLERINSQSTSIISTGKPIFTITNDESHAVLPQIEALLGPANINR